MNLANEPNYIHACSLFLNQQKGRSNKLRYIRMNYVDKRASYVPPLEDIKLSFVYANHLKVAKTKMSYLGGRH